MLNTIQTVADLNKFVALFGSLQPDDIIDKLADKKLIVSPVIAKLITDKIIATDHDCCETHTCC